MAVKPAGKRTDDGRGLRPRAPALSGVSPARECAYTVIRRVFEQGAYADRALTAEARGLEPRDRALATRLAYGTVQRAGTLDHVAARYSSRPPERLDAPVLAAVRLGLYQLLFLDGIGDACGRERVGRAVQALGARGGAPLVNAVLRRATHERGGRMVEALDDRTARARRDQALGARSGSRSCGGESLGAERARSLLAARQRARRVGDPGEHAQAPTRQQIAGAAARPGGPAGTSPRGWCSTAAIRCVHGSDGCSRPCFVIPLVPGGSMLVARALDPQPGDRVLDLCAAPGVKTTHLAALDAGNEGRRWWRSRAAIPAEARGGRCAGRALR